MHPSAHKAGIRLALVIVVGSAPAWVSVTAAGVQSPGTARAGADSSLGFSPARGPDGRFSVSDLTRTYERDLTVWTNADRSPVVDLAWLDQHGRMQPGDVAVAADSSDLDVVEGTEKRDPNTLTPAEKAAAEPPKPPVSLGIPSAAAVATSLIGGLALLVNLITSLAK